MKREININIANKNFICNRYFAGYAKEHLATKLQYTLSEQFLQNDCSYVLTFETAEKRTFFAAIPQKPVEYILPQGLMVEGVLSVQLSVLKSDTTIFKTSKTELSIRKSLAPTEDEAEAYVGLLEDSILKFNNAMEVLNHLPRIDKNGDWEFYNPKTGIYESSHVSAVGPQGPIGENYLLTDADKAEIGQKVIEDTSEDISAIKTNLNTADRTTGALAGFYDIQNCMRSNKNYAEADLAHWSEVNTGTKTISDGCLKLEGNVNLDTYGVYGKLKNSLTFTPSQKNTALVKIRCKSINGTIYTLPCWRNNGINGSFLESANILHSTPYCNEKPIWFEVSENTWTDIYLVIACPATATKDITINEVGLFLHTQAANTPELLIQHFEVFYNAHPIIPFNFYDEVRQTLPLAATKLPANNTLVPQTYYYLGNVDSVSIHFPRIAVFGQECYVTFNSGNTPTVLEVNTTNTTPLTLVPSANSVCEISAKWNGGLWMLLTSEVEL